MKFVSLSTITLTLATFLLISLAGCVGAAAALEGLAPVSDAGMQDALADQAEAQSRAVEEASEGDTISAALYSLIAGLSSMGIVVGASKRRRAKAPVA
jgi:hypothetical protein